MRCKALHHEAFSEPKVFLLRLSRHLNAAKVNLSHRHPFFMGANHVLNAVRVQSGSKSLLLSRRHIAGIDDLINFSEQISILLIKT